MEIADRIVLVRGRNSRASFAGRLKIQENTLRNYEKGLSLPNASVVARICTECNLNPTWLLFGSGPMHFATAEESGGTPGRETVPSGGNLCPNCRRLEGRIEAMEDERRELYRDNRQLLRENGELRARLAFIEGRRGHTDLPALGADEPRIP